MKKTPSPPPAALLTLQEAADEIGVHRSTVCRAAIKLQVGQMKGNAKFLSADDVKAIKAVVNPDYAGNPDIGTKYAGKIVSTRPDAGKPGRPKKGTQ